MKTPSGRSPWTRGVSLLVTATLLAGAASVAAALFTLDAVYQIHFNRDNLPGLRHRSPRLDLFQNPDDLAFTEFRLPHDRSLSPEQSTAGLST